MTKKKKKLLINKNQYNTTFFLNNFLTPLPEEFFSNLALCEVSRPRSHKNQHTLLVPIKQTKHTRLLDMSHNGKRGIAFRAHNVNKRNTNYNNKNVIVF